MYQVHIHDTETGAFIKPMFYPTNTHEEAEGLATMWNHFTERNREHSILNLTYHYRATQYAKVKEIKNG